MSLRKTIVRRGAPFIVGSMLPLLLTLIIINFLRLDTHIGSSKQVGDLLVFSAYLFMGLGVLCCFSGLRKYRISLLILSVVTILIVALEVSAFMYFKETGSLLGVEAVSYVLQNAKGMRTILLDSIDVSHLLGFVVLGLSLCLPVIIDRKIFF